MLCGRVPDLRPRSAFCFLELCYTSIDSQIVEMDTSGGITVKAPYGKGASFADCEVGY